MIDVLVAQNHEHAFPQRSVLNGNHRISTPLFAITSHREVRGSVRWSELSFLRATFLQDGLMAESRHVRRVYLVLRKKHREIYEVRENIPLDASVGFPKLIALTEKWASETIKRYAIGYRRRCDLIEEFPDSWRFRRLTNELTNKGKIASGSRSFQSNGIDGSRRLPWLACHVRAIEIY